MLSNPNISLIKDEFFCAVSDNVKIEETTKECLHMVVEVRKEDNSCLHHFFCEQNARNREQSRIKFFSVDNFPDGIFMKFNSDNRVEVHICELKKTPINNITRLSRQLLSGYIHSKLILNILDIDDSMIDFNYKIFMIRDRELASEYNQLPGTLKKVTPGQPITDPTDYQLWIDNKVKFEQQDYSRVFKVEKHMLVKDSESGVYQFNFKI